MKIYMWFATSVFVIDALGSIYMIDKDRIKISHWQAVAIVILNAVLLYGLWNWR